MSPSLLTEAELPEPGAFTTFHPFIKGVFSQWHPAPFALDGDRYVNAEQWMMASKARLFGDSATMAAIMAVDAPAEHKRLGQQVSGFTQEVWDRHRFGIVYRGNLAKFSQNEGARRQLERTAPALLVEANPRDWVWGCGLAIDDPGVHDPQAWRGTNYLGRILTLVRQRLMTVTAG